MANPKKLDKRRKSVRNIRKITRTMELIATARFKKAMDRASAASAYTRRMTELVADLARTGSSVEHPLMQTREPAQNGLLLLLTANRGLCGGYNGNATRAALARCEELRGVIPHVRLEISGKRGIGAFRYRKIVPDLEYTHFEDKPRFDEVELIANRYIHEYVSGKLDRLDVVYTRFVSISKQITTAETLLPLSSLALATATTTPGEKKTSERQYEFMPSAEAILKQVVPASFRMKLFKCFLDAAVSEQISRMVAMKSATENAGELIRQLSMTYNRARQSRITSEIMDIVGGVEALKS
jgi:F-type H+-transporting ATPase subunit gamma